MNDGDSGGGTRARNMPTECSTPPKLRQDEPLSLTARSVMRPESDSEEPVVSGMLRLGEESDPDSKPIGQPHFPNRESLSTYSEDPSAHECLGERGHATAAIFAAVVIGVRTRDSIEDTRCDGLRFRERAAAKLIPRE